MSLKYGLNVNKKSGPPARKPIFDDDEYDDEADTAAPTQPQDEAIDTFSNSTSRPFTSRVSKLTAPPPRRLDGPKADFSAARASRAKVAEAEALDSSIFDYDSFHDAKASVMEAKKAAQRQDAVERKPKYINNLLDAAARRKQDQSIAKEKALQREREAEGDEFADKEKFVTGAYKAQQEENRRLEEEEKKKAEEEEKRKRALGGGLQNLYRDMMDQTERQHQETLEAAAKLEREGGVRETTSEQRKTDAQIAAELKAKGINVHLNDEGQVTDKRELLTAGLNVAPSGRGGDSSLRGSDHLRSSNRPSQSAFSAGRNHASQQAQRERQTRMMEEQLEAQAKRAREEEEEEKERAEKAARTTKTEKDVSDAKARYLARKAAKERGDG